MCPCGIFCKITVKMSSSILKSPGGHTHQVSGQGGRGQGSRYSHSKHAHSETSAFFFGSDRSSRSGKLCLYVRPSVGKLSGALNLHLSASASWLHDDFMMTLGWLQDNFRMTSGWRLREHWTSIKLSDFVIPSEPKILRLVLTRGTQGMRHYDGLRGS